jgi:hypothetical protein
MFRETGSPQQRCDFDMVLPKRRNCFPCREPRRGGQNLRGRFLRHMSFPFRELGVI